MKHLNFLKTAYSLFFALTFELINFKIRKIKPVHFNTKKAEKVKTLSYFISRDLLQNFKSSSFFMKMKLMNVDTLLIA